MSVPARLAVMLALVFATRQGIYRLWDHPLWSWAPFAAAIAVYVLLLGPGRAELRLALIALTVGPLAEAALIGFGDLHRYALGWFLGVPLWIVLWWVLAAWIWGDLSGRLEALTRVLKKSVLDFFNSEIEKRGFRFPPFFADLEGPRKTPRHP